MNSRLPYIMCIALLLTILAPRGGAMVRRFPSLVPTPPAPSAPEGYVPAADLFNALSSPWVWDPLLGRLEVTLPTGERLILLVNSRVVGLEDRLFRLEDPVRFINNRLMVPESFITTVLEPVLGHAIELPTPTPEPTVFQPSFSPTPAIEFGPLPWPPGFHELLEPEPADGSEPSLPAIQRPIIVLDPGHGGEDRGAIGIGSTTEAEVALKIAQLCEEFLEASFDIDVSLTHREDSDLSTVKRAAFANGLGAQAFISLHAGGLFDPKRNIPSVFFLVPPTDRGLAGGEVTGVRWWDQPSGQPEYVRWQLGSAAWSKQSRDLAAHLHDALRVSYEDLQAVDFEDGPRPARLATLRGLLMPGVLVELGSLSNLETEQILHSEGFQRQLAESLARAIGNWTYKQQGRSWRETVVP